jgi:hypothetical protein
MGLCRRFGPGVLPSQVLAEDARILRLADVYDLGHREPEGGEEPDG